MPQPSAEVALPAIAGRAPRIRKVVFPVARRGLQFLPASKTLPKELLPVVDRPIIQYAVDEARAAGCEQFIFVSGAGKAAIEAHFDRDEELERIVAEVQGDAALAALREAEIPSGQAAFVRQHELRGLGHAVLCARELIGDEPFAVLLPDDMILASRPVLAQMTDRYPRVGGAFVAGIEVPRERVSRYGIMRIEDTGGDVVRVLGLQEKPQGDDETSNFSVTGRYILPPEVFDSLAAAEPDRSGSVQLTDAISSLTNSVGVHGFRYQGERFDCGAVMGYVRAVVAHAAAREELASELAPYLRRVLDRL